MDSMHSSSVYERIETMTPRYTNGHDFAHVYERRTFVGARLIFTFSGLIVELIAIVALVDNLLQYYEHLSTWGGQTRMAIPTAVCLIITGFCLFLIGYKTKLWK